MALPRSHWLARSQGVCSYPAMTRITNSVWRSGPVDWLRWTGSSAVSTVPGLQKIVRWLSWQTQGKG